MLLLTLNKIFQNSEKLVLTEFYICVKIRPFPNPTVDHCHLAAVDMNGSEPDEVGKKTPRQSLFLILQGNGMDSENHAAHTKVANLVSFFSYGGLASSPLPEDIDQMRRTSQDGI